ncbi:MAG: tetratricopeptide repeat protein, partial [Ferrovibrionaceae bacterium]
ALQRNGQAAEAEIIIRETLAASRRVFGDDLPLTQLLKYELGDLLLDAGRTDEAEALLSGLDPARLKDAKIQDDWPAVLVYQQGRLAWQRGDRARALALLERSADLMAGCRDPGPIGEADVRGLISRLRQED